MYDVVVLGATGITGTLATEYLSRNYATHSLVWAIAGRSTSRLQDLATAAGVPGNVGRLVCDVNDHDSVDSVVGQAKVILNFAGNPYSSNAPPIVAACVRRGVHYVDLSGELPLHRSSYDLHHAAAAESGAVILHGCGLGSVPADIGAYLAAERVRERDGRGCNRIKTLAMRVPLTRGTVSTMLREAIEESGKGHALPGAKEAEERGAYALDPSTGHRGPDEGVFGSSLLAYDRVAHSWAVPFLLGPVDGPVVRKSNALLSYRYGESVRYEEAESVSSAAGGVAHLLGLIALALALAFPPAHYIGTRLQILPPPHATPSRAEQESGAFETLTYAVPEGCDGAREPERVVKVHVRSGKAGDPAYTCTALMATECALSLALQRDSCPVRSGGVLTPASALGSVLVRRLRAAGMDISVEG